MKAADCIFLGLTGGAYDVARAAALGEFPGGTIAEVTSLDEALRLPVKPVQVLVLGDGSRGEVAAAVQAQAPGGLPRWGVVALGIAEEIPGAETVSADTLIEAVVARAIRVVVIRHRAARELERLRGDLLAIAYRISHDLRTPLGGILTAGEVLKECLSEKSPADAARVTPVFESAEDLGRLIDRVSFTLKASARPVPKQRAPLGEIVWSALQRTELEAVRLNALLIEPETWPEAQCVPTWTERIFENLISNALRHGGKPPRVELSWQRTGDEFRFCVRDNGPGVAEEIRPTLFQPFHSLHELNGSRGLGLSLTQRLVELQGGTCGYEPLPTGSRFFFTLPDTAAA